MKSELHCEKIMKISSHHLSRIEKSVLKTWYHRRTKYYATCDIHERHQQGIPHYKGVSLLSCAEGETHYKYKQMASSIRRHCVPNRWKCMQDVWKQGLHHQQFQQLLLAIDADFLYYCAVHWLSRGVMFHHVFALHNKITVFVVQRGLNVPENTCCSLAWSKLHS